MPPHATDDGVGDPPPIPVHRPGVETDTLIGHEHLGEVVGRHDVAGLVEVEWRDLAGADELVAKPVDPVVLKEALEQFLS